MSQNFKLSVFLQLVCYKWRGGQFIFWYALRFFQRCIKGYPDMRCISLLSHKEVWEWPLSPKYPTFAKNAEHHAAQTARHDSFHHFYESIEGTLVEDVCNHKYLDQIVFIRKEQSLLCDWMGWRQFGSLLKSRKNTTDSTQQTEGQLLMLTDKVH